MKIRIATLSDTRQIAAIGHCVWVDTYATEGVRQSIAEYVLSTFTQENIGREIQSKQVSIFEIDGHIVGYAVLSTSEENAEIETLYILPRFQGQGLGQQFIQHAIQGNPSLWLSCWDRNSAAIGFYRKLGFTETGETTFELDGEKHRNVLLTHSE